MNTQSDHEHAARLKLLDATARRREARNVETRDGSTAQALDREASTLESQGEHLLSLCAEPLEHATRYQLALRAEEPSALVWIARELLERASEKETRADVRASIQSALSALGEAHRQQESP